MKATRLYALDEMKQRTASSIVVAMECHAVEASLRAYLQMRSGRSIRRPWETAVDFARVRHCLASTQLPAAEAEVSMQVSLDQWAPLYRYV